MNTMRAAPRWSMALLLLACAAPVAAQEGAAKPGIAVIDLKYGGNIGNREDLTSLGIGIASSLTRVMSRNDRLDVVERAAIRAVLDEQKLTMSAIVDAATAAQIGKLIGVKYIVLGSYMGQGDRMRIDARVVEVETSRLRRAQEVTDKFDNLFESVDELADLLFRDLELRPSTPSPRQQPIPARAVLLLSRGIGHEDRGEREKAIEMYRAALEMVPDWEDAKQRLLRLEGGR